MTFIIPWTVYHNGVILCGLKNADATYKKTMTIIFCYMIHKEIEVYVDEVIIKSPEILHYLIHTIKYFNQLRKYNLKLNPVKCVFSMLAEKVL